MGVEGVGEVGQRSHGDYEIRFAQVQCRGLETVYYLSDPVPALGTGMEQ